MNGQTEEHRLIETVLTLLSRTEPDADGADRLQQLPGCAELQTAREIIWFMDEMPGGFFIYRAGGDEKILYANKALLRIFKCENMAQFLQLTGGSFQGMVHPEDLAAIEQSIAEQIASSQYDLDYVEYRILCRDGEIRWVDDYGHFIRSRKAGEFFYVFIGDATEKRKRYFTEKAALLDEKNQQLKNLFEEYNREKNLIQQEQLRQLEVIEGLGVNYDSILYADLDTDRISPYRLSLRTRKQFDEKFQTRSFLWYRQDYVKSWVLSEDQEMLLQATTPDYIRSQLSCSKTYYVNYRAVYEGEPQYIQLRIVDVSSHSQEKQHISQIVLGYRRIDEEFRREMDQKQMLEEALEKAKLAIAAKNTFLSNMSHDMRTPLNAIFGFTALIRKHLGETETALDYLSRVEASSRQLLNLIDKVLELSWVESRDKPPETEFDIRETMEEIYHFLLPQAEEKSIAFSLNCSALQHNHVCGDPDGFKQLLMYLANNAVTYTPTGGQVDISVIELKDSSWQYASYQFSVKDTGVGISKDFLQYIFEPFEREKNTTLSGIHGVGLGLTIAKNIVDRMNGHIAAESEPGKGSTFTVMLCFRIPENPPQPAAAEDTGGLPASLRLLLVEDNEINLEIETELLEELGFQVDTAADGSIAVQKIENAEPGDYDLILMDIQMPVMNGWQAARAIRELKNPDLAAIPIIALSANAFESDRQTSLESGMNAHLAKPFNISALLETMNLVLKTDKKP
ncbi:MAG: response regulator [Provencibacterium sp.]|jgi:PAS domain S-box-containing protein|nr:response regulator [Provencibacterium sp.]